MTKKKVNLALTLWLTSFIVLILIVIWFGARVFSYDICSAKANREVPEGEQMQLYTPTPEEIKSDPSLVNGNSRITGFYRGVLKCYRDSEKKFFLWY